MTNKEIVLNEIKRLEHNLKIYEKENMTPQIEYAKTNIKVNELILKDLEVLDIFIKSKKDYVGIPPKYDDIELTITIKKDNWNKIKEWLDGK